MDKTVLVVYASKYGATQGIAERVSRVLNEKEFDVELHPVDQVSDLTQYGAVVLGSAVYAGKWRKAAAAFLEKNQQVLAERPVWLFSSGPTGEGDPVALMNGWRFPEALQPIADRIQPRDIAFFGGELDLEKLSLPEKLIVNGIKAPLGDFRDWAAIEAWAAAIASALQSEAGV